MKNYSSSIARALMRYLRKANTESLVFEAQDGRIDFLQAGHGQLAYVHYNILVNKKGYTVNARCPITPVPGDAASMAATAEYLSRINNALAFGTNGGHLEGYFDLNCNSGLIEFKFFVDCYMRLSPAVIRDSLEWPGVEMDRVVPGLIDILFRGISPEVSMDDFHSSVERDMKIQLPKS